MEEFLVQHAEGGAMQPPIKMRTLGFVSFVPQVGNLFYMDAVVCEVLHYDPVERLIICRHAYPYIPKLKKVEEG